MLPARSALDLSALRHEELEYFTADRQVGRRAKVKAACSAGG